MLTDHEIKQTTDYIRAMEIILRHENIEELESLQQDCKYRIKKLREENETQAFM
jgi:hypothetical protein